MRRRCQVRCRSWDVYAWIKDRTCVTNGAALRLWPGLGKPRVWIVPSYSLSFQASKTMDQLRCAQSLHNRTSLTASLKIKRGVYIHGLRAIWVNSRQMAQARTRGSRTNRAPKLTYNDFMQDMRQHICVNVMCFHCGNHVCHCWV